MFLRLRDVESAAQRLKNTIHITRLERSGTFSKMAGGDIYLKYENQQKTGSFKIRGAYNKIAVMGERGEASCVVAASAGNHAQGVAYAATAFGTKSTIVMPRSAPIAKVSATQSYGAEVVLHGESYDDAYQKALEIQKAQNAAFIHPFNDPDVIAGQATIGLEILHDLPMTDTVLVPAGGGGLLSGIAFCIKNINPRVKIIGVQAQGADAICRSFRQKELVSLDTLQTIADGIAVKTPGDITQALINEYVDDMVTVPDSEIAATILLLLERDKQVVEPAGAVALAAASNGTVPTADRKTVCLLSGGNIDVGFIHRIIERGLLSRGRRMKFKTTMLDIPGSLEKFAKILAETGANIVMVQHDRLNMDLSLNEAILHIACEVSGFEHSRLVADELRSHGYQIILE